MFSTVNSHKKYEQHHHKRYAELNVEFGDITCPSGPKKLGCSEYASLFQGAACVLCEQPIVLNQLLLHQAQQL